MEEWKTAIDHFPVLNFPVSQPLSPKLKRVVRRSADVCLMVIGMVLIFRQED
jgi:hypothetical protein